MSYRRLLLFLLALTAGAAEPIPGQKSLIVIDGSFQFVHGSWASYKIVDKPKQETYLMRLAILDQQKRKAKAFSWMEIEVDMRAGGSARDPDSPSVVITRVLVEETAAGPGEIAEAIVQPEGYSPFRVPKKYLQPKDGKRDTGDLRPAHVVKRLETKTITLNGRSLEVVEVEATDSAGRLLRATVSEQLAPVGVCHAENEDVSMELLDWGDGATTRITGTPVNFYLWILEQVGRRL